MTVTGKTADSSVDYVSVYPEVAEVDLKSTGKKFTLKINLNDFSADTVNLYIRYKNGHDDEIEFEVTSKGFVPHDLSRIVDANRNAVENALEQPLNQVAEYIVEGGDPEEVRKVFDEITTLSNKICKGIKKDYDKLRAIERWVAANIYYDYPAYDQGVPAETLSLKYILENHSTVCGGYSNMVSALCAVQGIKCWNVHGSVLTGNNSFAHGDGGVYHEWNFAEINGRIIWADACWESYCKLQRDGRYDNGGIGYKYFDIGEEYFAVNHRANYAEYRDYLSLLK